jgi:alpha-ketoglutarate-dependent taurine dioxygenase
VKRPLLYQQIDEHGEPRIIIQFSRRSFTGYGSLARSSELPPLTESQAVALDALHFLAKKHSLVLDFQKGDIQYVNNLSILHARNGYTEDTKRQYVQNSRRKDWSSQDTAL